MIAREWRDVRKVLAVRLDNLGDVLMTGPALRALKRALPHSRITMLASPGGAQAAALLPWLDDVIEHRALWQDLGSLKFDPKRELRLIDRLAREEFDAAVIFTSFSQTPHVAAYVCYLAGIPLRIGASKEFGGGVLRPETRVTAEADGEHQVDRNLALLEPLGFEVDDLRLALSVPAEARIELERIVGDAGMDPGQPFVVASPWASCPARTYRPELMVSAARQIGSARGWPVVVTGLARHRNEFETLAAGDGEGLVDLVGALRFPEFAALVQRCTLLLTNNSGPMHVAEATGTPMVVAFSGTDLESQWRPRFAPARLLRQPTRCRPCYLFDCAYEGHPCLALSIEEVVDAGMELSAGRLDAAPA